MSRSARWLFCLVLVAGLAGCEKKEVGVKTAPTARLPPATPGLELQEQDYAQVRRQFRTKLLRKGLAPQRWQPVRPPEGVTAVEYPSGGLRLKACVKLRLLSGGLAAPAACPEAATPQGLDGGQGRKIFSA